MPFLIQINLWRMSVLKSAEEIKMEICGAAEFRSASFSLFVISVDGAN